MSISKNIIDALKNQDIKADSSQLSLIESLTKIKLDKNFSGAIRRLTRKENLGIYIWGDVGRGKTLIVKEFIRQLKDKRIRSFHYIDFMTLIHDELKNNPGYIYGKIPASAYKSLNKDIPTLGIVTSMIVHKDLPTDLVYKMAKVFWDNHSEFVKVKSVWKKVLMKDAVNGAAVPIHPGAAKFYKEKGIM